MKKKNFITAAVLGVAFMVFAPAKADLFGTFKKIGEGIDQVSRAIDKVNDSKKKSQSKQSQDQSLLDINIEEAVRWGDKMLVFYRIRNNSNDNISNLWFAQGSSLQETECYLAYENGKTSSFDYGDYLRGSSAVPGGALRRGAMLASTVPAKAKTVDIVLKGGCNMNSQNYKIEREFYEVPIRGFQPSNLEGCYVTHPNVKLHITEVTRAGEDVTVSFTLTNLEDEDIAFFLNASDGLGYDDNGKEYRVRSENQNFKLRSQRPFTLTVYLPNVPERTTGFQNITVPINASEYDLPGSFDIVFNDLMIN